MSVRANADGASTTPLLIDVLSRDSLSAVTNRHNDASATPHPIDDSIGRDADFANVAPSDFRGGLAEVWVVGKDVGRMKQPRTPLGGHFLTCIVPNGSQDFRKAETRPRRPGNAI